MKKIILIMLLLCIMPLLAGCYNYGRGSFYGVLIGFEFYDTEYNEIEGEYINYFHRNFDEELSRKLKLNNRYVPINSPAPIELFYTTTVEQNASIIVRIKVQQNNGYHFHSITINTTNVIEKGNFYNIDEDEKRIIYLDYLVENITAENRIYEVTWLYMSKEDSNNTTIKQGSRFIEGRSYYSGFVFKIAQTNDV